VFEAAATGQLARVKALVTAKPRLVHSRSHDGFSPLHLAAFFGHAGAVSYLLKHKPNVNDRAQAQGGVTPLGSAAAANQNGICALLIEHGADVNARQEGGFAPLHAAAQNGNLTLVKLLLAAGADKSARTSEGKLARDFALAGGHAEAAALLVPRIGALNRVIVFVKDMTAMRAFYEQKLGLTAVGYADEGWVSYDAGGSSISLHRQTGAKHSGGSALQIVFHSDDVPAAREELIARGVAMGKLWSGDGLSFSDGQDPEGNWFQISSR
jgi:predicted enzyme related to lactoylglutathione lyase